MEYYLIKEKMSRTIGLNGVEDEQIQEKAIHIISVRFKPEPRPGPIMLRAEGITRRAILHQCSFEVRAGEILGFAGLIGSGRTELGVLCLGPIPSTRVASGWRESASPSNPLPAP
jgi:ABC-type sugar transport system ATPase subunit